MQLSEHFTLREFRCKDGTDVPAPLVDALSHHCKTVLEVIRHHLGVPVVIISGYRTKAYNDKIGGAKASLHRYELRPGRFATDLRAKGYTPKGLRAVIVHLIETGAIPPGGVGLYDSFVHYDNRGYNARWSSTATKDA